MPINAREEIVDGNFSFRVRIGECEIEMTGRREDVLRTLRKLPKLFADVQKASQVFDQKSTTRLTVKAGLRNEEDQVKNLPKIGRVKDCTEAVLDLLGTDWGKWRPHTIDELRRALKANGLDYPGRTLSGTLTKLVGRNAVRRWRTDGGYVYILAEEEALA